MNNPKIPYFAELIFVDARKFSTRVYTNVNLFYNIYFSLVKRVQKLYKRTLNGNKFKIVH